MSRPERITMAKVRAARPGRQKARIVMAVMPFGSLERPSIAAAMIQARLLDVGDSCHVDYANLRFADRIGLAAYDLCSRRTDCTDLLGEWLFARAAFGDHAKVGCYFDDYIMGKRKALMLMKNFLGEDRPAALKSILDDLSRRAAEFIDETADHILAMDPEIVAATTIFQQSVASIALLRRIKERRPDIRTIIGGANCEEPMGSALEEICPWIDTVHKGRSEGHLNQIFSVTAGDADASQAHPDFDDYFAQLEQAKVRGHIRPALPIEMSTGCWYGEKSHCTFCGLNGNTMAFKFRGADEVFDEITAQKERYGLDKFMAVDNIIAMDYFKTLLPRVVESGTTLSMFIETKANLKSWQLDLMAEAGFGWIQPGIESLSNQKLKRFKKGTDLKTNLTLLKQSMERGIAASWLLLVNDPGDDPEENRQMAELFPKLAHLMPPANIVPVRFDRFSPYHFKAQEFGLTLEPYRSYAHVYPPEADLNRLAYYFEDYTYPRPEAHSPALAPLYAALQAWANAFYGVANSSPSELKAHTELTLDLERHVVRDRRRPHFPCDHPLNADDEGVLTALHEGLPKSRFATQFRGYDLTRLLAADVVIDTGDHYLSLATFPYRRGLPRFEDFPCGAILMSAQ